MQLKDRFINFLLLLFVIICFLSYVYYNNRLFPFLFLFLIFSSFFVIILILKFNLNKRVNYLMFQELFLDKIEDKYILKSLYILLIFFVFSMAVANAFLFNSNNVFWQHGFLFIEWNIITTILKIVLFYTFFIVLFYAIGKKILKMCSVKFKSSLVDFVFSLGISFIILAFSIFILLILGIFYKSVVFLLVLLVLFFSRKEIRRICINIWKSKIELDFRFKFSTVKSIILVVLFVLLIFNFIGIIKPIPISVDDLSTYFNVPSLLVQYHKYRPMMHHSAANRGQNTEMIYAFIMSIVGEKYVVYFQFFSFILVIITFYNLLKEVFGEKYAILAIISLYFIPWNLYYASTSKVEFFLCFYLVLMLYSAFLWQKYQKDHFLYFLGIFSGMAMGIKYTAIFLIVPIYFIILIYLISRKIEMVKFFKSFVLSIFLAILLFSPWGIKNKIYFGNVFFPDKFILGKFDTGIGGLTFSPQFKVERRQEMNYLRHSVFKNKYNPFSILETLWDQSVGRNIDNGFWLDFGFLPILIIPFYFLYLFYYRDKKFVVFLSIALLYMLFWYVADGARSWYGIFGIMMLYACLPYLFLKNKPFLLLYIFFIIVIFSGSYFLIPENLSYLSGQINKEQYMEKRLDYYDQMKFINSLDLHNEKILLTGQYKTYGIKRNDQTTLVDAYYVKSGYNLSQGYQHFYNALKKSNINYIARRLKLENEISGHVIIDWLGIDLNTYLSQYKGNIPSFFESVKDLGNFTNKYTTRVWLSKNGDRAIYKLK